MCSHCLHDCLYTQASLQSTIKVGPPSYNFHYKCLQLPAWIPVCLLSPNGYLATWYIPDIHTCLAMLARQCGARSGSPQLGSPLPLFSSLKRKQNPLKHAHHITWLCFILTLVSIPSYIGANPQHFAFMVSSMLPCIYSLQKLLLFTPKQFEWQNSMKSIESGVFISVISIILHYIIILTIVNRNIHTKTEFMYQYAFGCNSFKLLDLISQQLQCIIILYCKIQLQQPLKKGDGCIFE